MTDENTTTTPEETTPETPEVPTGADPELDQQAVELANKLLTILGDHVNAVVGDGDATDEILSNTHSVSMTALTMATTRYIQI